MFRIVTGAAVALCALAASGCQFSPTAPFDGFDGLGSRVSGRFEPEASMFPASTHGSPSSVDPAGITITVAERPSLTATVNRSGEFSVAGVPSGSFTLVFRRDGVVVGEIRFQHVRSNQGLRITVVLTSGNEVVLVREDRDRVSFSDECPRGAGFWCQNQSGRNPNLSASEFDRFATEAARLLASVPELDTRDEIAAAVCRTSDQFLRQLAALALNLASGTVKRSSALTGEEFTTVGAVLDAAIAHLTSANRLGHSEAQRLKDVIDRLNNAQNVDGCDGLRDDDDDDDDQPAPPQGDPQPPAPTPSGQMTICHIPPGNYNARHTITIDASAWPAHQRHCAQGTCDYQGACR